MDKTGIGYDVHALEPGRKLVIGGVVIPGKIGSVGHSDGDALIHAMVDALLGAAGAGDIGQFFPSDNKKWKGADSKQFLTRTIKIVRDKGFELNHMDSIVILQEPKIDQYIPQMRYLIAYTLQVDEASVSVKATTTDRLGFIGQGLGWAAQAIATVQKV